jgi:hypothetical protein
MPQKEGYALMRWVKHMTAAWDDERIAKLVGKGGVEGLAAYGIWWRLIEIIASRVDGKSTQCSVTYDVTRWSLLLSLRGSHVRHWIEKLALTGVLTAEWVGTEITVTIPKLLKYRDEYSKKSGQCQVQDTEEEQKKIRTKVETETTTDAVRVWFESEFYPIFPRHKAVGQGLKAARAHLKTEALRMSALTALKAQLPEMMERDPSKRPYPATWINGRCWEDETQPLFQIQESMYPNTRTSPDGYTEYQSKSGEWKR